MLTGNQIRAFLGLSVAFWIGLLWLRGIPLSWDMLVPFSSVVGGVSLVLLAFDRWIWHWPIFTGWLVNRPYLHGTWQVRLQSSWINPDTKAGIPPIECFMVVRQTHSSASFRLITAESKSETVSSGVEVCKDGTFEITCAYRNRPRSEFRHRSEVHYGAMLLAAESSRPEVVEGEYWTDRKTTGTVTMRSRKRGSPMTFAEANKLFATAVE